MKYLLPILLFTAGCATSPVTYTTGDCMEQRVVFKVGKQTGQLENGEGVFEIDVVESWRTKVRCPDDRPMREFHGRADR